MKKQNVIYSILLSVLILGACSKNSGDSNLVGTWDVYTVSQSTYTNGVLDSAAYVQHDLGTYTFNAKGDGEYSVTNEGTIESGTFDWFEQNDKVFINMLNLTDSIMTKNFAVGFDVITNKSTQQVWSLTYSYYQKATNPNTGTQVNYLKKTYMEMDLRKQ